MNSSRASALTLICLLLVGAVVFFTGIDWGLPSRSVDRFLFATESPWPGGKILALAGGWDADAKKGADVDRTPSKHHLVLNETDAQRAEIVRRYRLYSYQPDEMITFRALANMKPGELSLDPKLYQYGGLWIYPVGAMLKVASLCKLIDLRADLSFYLDHPEAFGKFYIVARAYSALWGLVGVWAVFSIAKRLGAPLLACAFAAGAFIFLPVVVNMAHEAKPHLAGGVLQLLAMRAALEFVATRRLKFFWIASVLCGAALGMVISSLWILSVLPIALWTAKPQAAGGIIFEKRVIFTVLGFIVAAGVYGLTNPYVLINLIRDPDVLRSNLGNSTAMYQLTPVGAAQGTFNVARLIGEGVGTPLAIAGVVLGLRHFWKEHRSAMLLLLVPAGILTFQLSLMAAGKPPEFGRFLLLIDVVLAIMGIIALAHWRPAFAMVALAWTIFCGLTYLQAFLADRGPLNSRIVTAELLRDVETISLQNDPGPYNCPPVDLFKTKIIRVPSNPIVAPRETIKPFGLIQTPMSWANVRFVVNGR